MTFRPRLLLIALAALLAGLPARHAAAGDARALVVIELFTSQGCNSCPPADALLAEWNHDASVLPLSLHVDYWDYLGWKDTFAKRGHSTRQQNYVKQIGSRQVYTPQAVIDGQLQAVGSNRAAVEAAVKAARQQKHVPVTVERDASGRPLAVNIAALTDASAEAIISLCLFDRQQQVTIGRGENSGQTISYVNVARGWQDLGRWHGAAQRVALPDLPGYDWQGSNAAILLQSLQGPILGAAVLAPR